MDIDPHPDKVHLDPILTTESDDGSDFKKSLRWVKKKFPPPLVQMKMNGERVPHKSCTAYVLTIFALYIVIMFFTKEVKSLGKIMSKDETRPKYVNWVEMNQEDDLEFCKKYQDFTQHLECEAERSVNPAIAFTKDDIRA